MTVSKVDKETKSVILYGNGASARGFLESGFDEYDVIVAATDSPSSNEFEGYDNICTEDVHHYDFDYIVVASWAIHEITERLNRLDIDNSKILWFQHHKNRILEWGHSDFYQSHEHIDEDKILYAVYDMNVARATFDIIGFLCLAECERIKRKLSAVHVVIVNASNNEFNNSRWGLQNKNEHDWRIHQVLMQCCSLLPSCHGVSKTATRAEVLRLLQGVHEVFPQGYTEASPVIEYEFNLLFERVNRGEEVAHLKANAEALSFVRQYLAKLNPENKKVITVTLRESVSKPLRNSKKSEWLTFLQWLNKEEYYPVVLPDTENAFWGEDNDFAHFHCLSVAAFNVEFRMALYELSYLNLGVNNGPIHLCALNKSSAYIMFKQVVEIYPHSSSQSFLDRGFTIGGDFPGAGMHQKFVWEDDDFNVLRDHFLMMIERLEAIDKKSIDI